MCVEFKGWSVKSLPTGANEIAQISKTALANLGQCMEYCEYLHDKDPFRMKARCYLLLKEQVVVVESTINFLAENVFGHNIEFCLYFFDMSVIEGLSPKHLTDTAAFQTAVTVKGFEAVTKEMKGPLSKHN